MNFPLGYKFKVIKLLNNLIDRMFHSILATGILTRHMETGYLNRNTSMHGKEWASDYEGCSMYYCIKFI